MKVKSQKPSSTNDNIFTSLIQASTEGINFTKPLNIIKLETVDVTKLQFKEVSLLAEKQKWMKRFRKSYSGGVTPESDSDYAKKVKFIVATFEGSEVGFLRIVNWKARFSKFTNQPATNISEGYVKPAYQGQGVLREMIKHAIAKYNAVSLTISNDRIVKYGRYYATLGFTHMRSLGTTDCSRLYLDSWVPFVNALLDPKP